jgi:hypothetical protein
MRLEEHFESSSTLQRNERVKLAASFWNNVGAVRWPRLSEQIFRIDKWSVCRVRLPSGGAAW